MYKVEARLQRDVDLGLVLVVKIYSFALLVFLIRHPY